MLKLTTVLAIRVQYNLHLHIWYVLVNKSGGGVYL